MSVTPTTFHELYTRYSQDVYCFAYWLTGDADEAKDITSETFVLVWTSEAEIRTASVKAYLFTIARNLYLKQQRRTSRHAPMDDRLPDTAVDLDRTMAAKDELKRTLATLQTFPEIDRTVLLLRAQEELSYEDIAAATGLSLSAAKVKVFRARAKLLKLLERNNEEPK
jgi:RNA polymerase sigma-70 factor, ECF subfamily